jgi:hypothetical protein
VRKHRFLFAGVVAAMLSTSAQADISISTKPTQNMSCVSRICTATAQKAVLNVGDLQTMLASGDVSVKTGGVALNIEIIAPLTWASLSRLALDAQQSIFVKKPIIVGGKGGVTLAYDTAIGDLHFVDKGSINLLKSTSGLTINGAPYVLTYDVASLAAAVGQDNSGNFALATDYDASNESYDDAPVPVFFGKFEGLGHRISHLSIRGRVGRPATGFFGQSGGIIRDIFLKNINFSAAKATYAGALAGLNAGLIVHARVSGGVRGKDKTLFIGGLVGYNHSDGTILKSSSAATVTGSVGGGLVGLSEGLIDQSFSEGKVTSAGGGLVNELSGGKITNSYASGPLPAGIGGLVGVGNIAVSASYSTGQVATGGGFVGGVASNDAQNAHWDIDTSGQTQGCGSGDCSGITGLSDAQLKSSLPPGFDPKIWAQDPKINSGYPYLRNNPPQ